MLRHWQLLVDAAEKTVQINMNTNVKKQKKTTY